MDAYHRQINKNLMNNGVVRGVMLRLSSREYPYHTATLSSMRTFTDVAPLFLVEHPRLLMSSAAPVELRHSLFFSSSSPGNPFFSSSCFSALHFSRRSFFFISKKKVRTQLSAMKHEAENARKNAKEDVEKAKRYGIRSFGLDMLDVADTLEKGIEAFERHRERFGDSQGPATSPPPTTADDRESRSNHTTDTTTTTTTSTDDARDGESEIPSNAPQTDSLSADSSNNEGNDNSRPLHSETDRNKPNTSNSNKAEVKSLESIFMGMQLSMRVLQKHLRSHGIEKIPVQCGEKFDPRIHDAVSGVPTSSKMPVESIAVVLKNGYKIKERVLRPAQVAVVVEDQVKDE